MAELPAIGMQEAVPEQKKSQKSRTVKKESGTPKSARRRPSTKVAVACDFCRGKHIGRKSMFVFENLIERSIGIPVCAVRCGFGSVLCCWAPIST